MDYHYDQDTLTAFDAITEAQRIAFAPMLFQAAVSLRDSGLLAALDKQGKNGATLAELVAQSTFDEYAVSVLLDMGLSGRIVYQQGNRYQLSKIGHFLLHDPMTRVNMDFTQNVCYQGLFYLRQALATGQPCGLSVFGDWPTIYPALSELPEATRTSWFAFDHYYSDSAFTAALTPVFALSPRLIYDIGGNTGKWAIRCCQHDPQVQVTLLDLPQQISLARKYIDQAGLSQRITLCPTDILQDTPLPDQADVWWMSQFLDCFSPQHIVTILRKVARSMPANARLCIMELFWDRQKFEAAAFSLNASSLYFSCMANGYSRFYRAECFINYIHEAGFCVEQQIDHLGIGHTLLICKTLDDRN